MNISFLYQGYLLSIKPFASLLDNNLALLNEILLSLTFYLFLLSSDVTDNTNLKIYSGYGLLGILGLSCIANLGVFAVRVIYHV